jgi:hypothetical protein
MNTQRIAQLISDTLAEAAIFELVCDVSRELEGDDLPSFEDDEAERYETAE